MSLTPIIWNHFRKIARKLVKTSSVILFIHLLYCENVYNYTRYNLQNLILLLLIDANCIKFNKCNYRDELHCVSFSY